MRQPIYKYIQSKAIAPMVVFHRQYGNLLRKFANESALDHPALEPSLTNSWCGAANYSHTYFKVRQADAHAPRHTA